MIYLLRRKTIKCGSTYLHLVLIGINVHSYIAHLMFYTKSLYFIRSAHHSVVRSALMCGFISYLITIVSYGRPFLSYSSIYCQKRGGLTFMPLCKIHTASFTYYISNVKLSGFIRSYLYYQSISWNKT